MIYDISTPLSESTPVYPGDPTVRINRVSDLADGADCTLSEISMSLHAGTHIDAPSHFIPGAPSADTIPLDLLIGDAILADIETPGAITAAALEELAISPASTRLLLRTPDSRQETALDAGAAQWLVDAGVKLIGIDSLSIGFADESTAVHTTLLSASVVILESLSLLNIPSGKYKLICLPLKITGTEAAPARAILID
jgi:arylformamidase